jgi:hypothetical protein
MQESWVNMARIYILIHGEGNDLRPSGRGDQKIFILYHVDNF